MTLRLDATRKRSRELLTAGDPERFRRYMRRAAARYPDDAGLQVLRGVSEMSFDRNAAYDHLVRSTELKTTDAKTLMSAASNLVTIGACQVGLDVARRAEGLAQNYPDLLLAINNVVGRAIACLGTDDVYAERLLTIAVEDERTNVHFLRDLILFLLRHDRAHEAHCWTEAAPDAVRNHPFIIEALGAR